MFILNPIFNIQYIVQYNYPCRLWYSKSHEKLTELLTKLQQPEPHQLTSVPYQNTTQLQIAQLTNINKKISIYQEELQKIKDKNYPKIISEIKSIKNSIF